MSTSNPTVGQAPGFELAALGAAVPESATNAFMHGIHSGDWVAAGISVTGAVFAFILLPAHPGASSAPELDPAARAVPSPVAS